MSNDCDELEKQVQAKAEEATRKVLAELPDKSELTMKDIEHRVGQMGHEVMQGMMQSLVESQQAVFAQVMCEDCQVQMHKRGKQVITGSTKYSE